MREKYFIKLGPVLFCTTMLLCLVSLYEGKVWGKEANEKGKAQFEKQGDIYLIQSAEDLRRLAQLVNKGQEVEPGVSAQTASYLLTTDIDISEYCKGKGWEPIGRNTFSGDSGYFNGSFDGGNHVVYGLYINRPEEQGQGLFGCREDLRSGDPYRMEDMDSPEFKEKQVTEIRNLFIKDCQISGGVNTGAVMGGLWNFFQEDYGTINIENCHVTGTISAGGDSGGIVGSASSVKNSSFQGTIVSNGSVGGIAGEVYYVDGCYVRGQVKGDYHAGGIGGTAVCVRNSYCIGTVEGYCGVGGITGWGACITGCYTRADVSGYSRTGGLIGDIQSMAVRVPKGASSGATISQCFMGGEKITRVPENKEREIYPENRFYNGYIYGFPGAGIDRDIEVRWPYRAELKAEGFDSSFYSYMCKPVLWEAFDQQRWEEMLGMPDTSWEEVWADTADNTYPRLKWEEENPFSHTVTLMVREGESLSQIAARLLGDGSRWTEIYRDNHIKIGDNPNIIYAGTELDIEVIIEE